MGKLIKIKEASEILGVTYRILRGWDAKGLIQTVRTPGGTRLFAVEDYLKSQEQAKTDQLVAGQPGAPAVDAGTGEGDDKTIAGGSNELTELDSWKADVEAVFKAVHAKAQQSDFKYPICFEMASKWIGFSRKDAAKRHLLTNFEENSDFFQPPHECGGCEISRPDENGIAKPGPVGEKIYLTAECFKSLCMTAQTAQGKRVRKYYLELEDRWRKGDLSLAGEIVRNYDEINETTTNVLLKTSPIGTDGIAVNVPRWVPEWRDARTDQKDRGKTLRDVLKDLNIPDVNVYAMIENMHNQGVLGFSGTTTKWRRDNGVPDGKPLAECMDKTQLDLRRMMSLKLIELYSKVEEPSVADIKKVAEGVKAKIGAMSEYMNCNEYRPHLNEETGEETYIGKRVREIEKAQRRSIKRLKTLERRQALLELVPLPIADAGVDQANDNRQLTIGAFFKK